MASAALSVWAPCAANLYQPDVSLATFDQENRQYFDSLADDLNTCLAEVARSIAAAAAAAACMNIAHVHRYAHTHRRLHFQTVVIYITCAGIN